VCCHAALKGRHREALGVHFRAVDAEVDRVDALDRVRERVDVVELRQQACQTVIHGLQRPARGRRDHRPAGRLRLDGDDAELLHAGDHDRAGFRVQLRQLHVVRASEELRLGEGLFQGGVIGPAADHADRRACPARGLQRDVQTLVRDQLGDDQQRVAGVAGGEAMGLHGRVDHGRLAPVVALDPFAAELRDGDVRVHAPARREVPPAHPAQLAAQQAAQRPRGLRHRTGLLVPRVAKRRVAVADVHGPVGHAYTVGERAAAAEHHVAGGQSQALDRERVERQQPPEARLADAQPLQWGGRDRASGEAAARPRFVVEQREDRRLVEQFGDRREGPLGAAHHQ
jgi:hypothetical protein